MSEGEKKKYYDKADEYNIIVQEMGLPQKRPNESSDISDTESDVIMISKKPKTT
jgi:hypothetical protein